MKYCHKCKTPWEGLTQPTVRETCPHCGEDLHVCLNCRLYDPGRSNQCRVDTDPVVRKDRANYCEEFLFADRNPAAPPSAASPTDKAREQFKKLFGK